MMKGEGEQATSMSAEPSSSLSSSSVLFSPPLLFGLGIKTPFSPPPFFHLMLNFCTFSQVEKQSWKEQVNHSKDDLRKAEAVASTSSPLSYVNTSSLDTRRDDGVVDFVSPLSSINVPSSDISSKTAQEKLHENTTAIVGISISSGVSEKQSDSKPPKQQLVEPLAPKMLVPAVEKKGCNLGKGRWVTDESWPLYSGFGCKQWLSGMWACRLTQRTDFGYEKLKWQPKDCKMDNFTGPEFLKRMQDKTLAFIGDSLGRQQFQSLMCMITGGKERHDVQDVGKEYGLVKARHSVRPDGWAYRFPVTNTTILYYWSASLCELDPIGPINGTTYFAMHLDRPPAFLQRYISRFNVVVLNTGHHWNRGKLNANRWVMYVGGKPNTNRKIAEIANAKNLTIYSIIKWVNGELPKYPGLKAFYRSISPRHFFNGDWNSGGTCDSTAPGALEVLTDESSDSIASGAVKGTDVKLFGYNGIISGKRRRSYIKIQHPFDSRGCKIVYIGAYLVFPTHGMNYYFHKFEVHDLQFHRVCI